MPSSSAYDYRRFTEALTYSRDHFEEAERLFSSEAAEQFESLKTRWQTVLAQGADLAGWVEGHYRAQSPQVYTSLEELAKYADVRRPFRLSVIGQKGVGKSALVNVLLGASEAVQYTPSDIAGKALSATRIRLIAGQGESENRVWRVVFLTPRRLWEVGTFLLTVARQDPPRPPADLNNREAVMDSLTRALNSNAGGSLFPPNSANQIQAEAARKMLAEMVAVYRHSSELIPAGYSLELEDPDVNGPIASYIRQSGDDRRYLIVDWVERYLPAQHAGFLAGRAIELEDVLGLDDPRDSFFALEAFREAFAVVMVFKCDRPLGTETSAILQSLFQRGTEPEAGNESASFEKAIIVANRFDELVAGVTPGSNSNPLKAVEEIRTELARYQRHNEGVPIYLTSASLAGAAQTVLSRPEGPRPPAAYSSYLDGLSNLLQAADGVANRSGQPAPDYLDFIYERRSQLEAENLTTQDRAKLTLELSGLPRLVKQVNRLLETRSILNGRVVNAEYAFMRVVSETALCYARQMRVLRVDLAEFNSPAVSMESRLFSRFQHEIRLRLEQLDDEVRGEWFALAQRYIYGPHSEQVNAVRQGFMETLRNVIAQNRALIQIEQHISSGQMVTDAWRRVFEDINDWLALEAGRQFRALVGPLIVELEGLAGQQQKMLAELAAYPVEESFWLNYRSRLDRLRQRLYTQAESMGMAFYTDNRFSVYDEKIAHTLGVGSAEQRREALTRLLVEKVDSWFSRMWQLLARVAMTDLNMFVSEIRHYGLGLPAERSLLIGVEIAQPGSGRIAPEQSLIALLEGRYHTDEAFRRQYALREPSPAERLSLEIRGWLKLILPPLEGLAELNRAVSTAGTTPVYTSAETGPNGDEDNQSQPTPVQPASDWPSTVPAVEPGRLSVAPGVTATAALGYTRLKVPVESLHPYHRTTRQYWDVTNPDEGAQTTRLHFSKIELDQGNEQKDFISIETPGGTQRQVISGQHTDFWSEPFVGRTVRVRFQTDSARPGWGFVLDGYASA